MVKIFSKNAYVNESTKEKVREKKKGEGWKKRSTIQ